jgi:hypothetical protein
MRRLQVNSPTQKQFLEGSSNFKAPSQRYDIATIGIDIGNDEAIYFFASCGVALTKGTRDCRRRESP